MHAEVVEHDQEFFFGQLALQEGERLQWADIARLRPLSLKHYLRIR
jgi:hypothetical protein